MSDIVIAENSTHRVVANHSPFGDKPEHQGLPEVILSDYHASTYFNEAWNNSVDRDAIVNAFHNLSYDNFVRWIKICEDDIVNHSVVGIEDDELIFAHVSKHYGYSQGDMWVQIVWTSTDNPDPDYVSELVNWARGDVYSLSLEKKETYSLIDPDDDNDEEEDLDIITWDEINTVHGYYTDDPENCQYVKDVAKHMLTNAPA